MVVVETYTWNWSADLMRECLHGVQVLQCANIASMKIGGLRGELSLTRVDSTGLMRRLLQSLVVNAAGSWVPAAAGAALHCQPCSVISRLCVCLRWFPALVPCLCLPTTACLPANYRVSLCRLAAPSHAERRCRARQHIRLPQSPASNARYSLERT